MPLAPRTASPATTYSPADIARITGLSAQTLRWYEEEGLIDIGATPARDGGERVYQPAHLRWLELLNHLRNTGMPVTEMMRYVELTRDGDATLTARRELLESHREKVGARVTGMTATLRHLDWKISFYREREHAMRGAGTGRPGPTGNTG